MKKILKKEVIIAFVIGIILASSIAVYAYSYASKDISYTKPGTTQAISVEQALNDLYSKGNCRTLQFQHTANTQFDYDFGFVPSKFLAFFQISNEVYATISLNTISNSLFASTTDDFSMSNNLAMNSTKLTSNFNTNWYVYTNDYTIYVYACE